MDAKVLANDRIVANGNAARTADAGVFANPHTVANTNVAARVPDIGTDHEPCIRCNVHTRPYLHSTPTQATQYCAVANRRISTDGNLSSKTQAHIAPDETRSRTSKTQGKNRSPDSTGYLLTNEQQEIKSMDLLGDLLPWPHAR